MKTMKTYLAKHPSGAEYELRTEDAKQCAIWKLSGGEWECTGFYHSQAVAESYIAQSRCYAKADGVEVEFVALPVVIASETSTSTTDRNRRVKALAGAASEMERLVTELSGATSTQSYWEGEYLEDIDQTLSEIIKIATAAKEANHE
jgi:hypothetical protein